jgi:hypothetical protein
MLRIEHEADILSIARAQRNVKSPEPKTLNLRARADARLLVHPAYAVGQDVRARRCHKG